MIALIDADVVLWRAAFSAEHDPAWVAKARADDMMYRLLDGVVANSYEAYITGPRKLNFRTQVYPDYKANREGMPQPRHKEVVKELLLDKWNAKQAIGNEADDELGIRQCELNNQSVICAVDKDLLMVPGSHYNFVKEIKTQVTPMGGLRHFFKQLLIGDTADNVVGIRGIGEKKAAKLIDPLDSFEEMLDCVRAVYKDDTRLLMNCDVLWIQQKPKEMFTDRFRKELNEQGFEETYLDL